MNLENFEKPLKLKSDYKYAISYTYPGPLPCGLFSEKCSKPVDAGIALGGVGVFCNYMVLCAGLVVTVLYDEFRLVT